MQDRKYLFKYIYMLKANGFRVIPVFKYGQKENMFSVRKSKGNMTVKPENECSGSLN